VRERAQATGERAAVITFDPHPMRVLHPERAPVMIQTLAQRLAGFEELGLDAALVLRFDRALSLMSAENFIDEILAGALRAGAILVGANFRFGHRGAGDVHLLTEYGKTRGFGVEIVAPVEVDGRVVSSTAIRAAVAGGDVEGAIPLLGRAFSLTGEIRSGAGRGRTILFPTLNLAAEQELLPKLGVYATECLVNGKLYSSVTNVGTRPTFNGSGVTVESHLFGFSENLTDGRMEVRFHSRIRDERKFSGAEELRAQIARDIEAARKFFSERTLAGNYSRE
jgi:riboflavin kinase/FMN adenylyltransferase